MGSERKELLEQDLNPASGVLQIGTEKFGTKIISLYKTKKI